MNSLEFEFHKIQSNINKLERWLNDENNKKHSLYDEGISRLSTLYAEISPFYEELERIKKEPKQQTLF